jgi:hypothetical protein
MYTAFLYLHSIVRWLVVATGFFAVFQAQRGSSRSSGWVDSDARPGLFFVIAVDLQFTIGLVMYLFVSPITRSAMQNFGAAMHERTMRFFAVEHVTLAVLALIAVHVTRVRARKADASKRNRLLLVGFVFALILVLAATPWPFLPYGRGWLV